jgi:predicted metal-dependent hydrolase
MLPYRLVRERRRSVSLSVGPDGVLVKAPLGLPDRKIDEFVSSRHDWILRQKKRIWKRLGALREPGMYEDRLLFMGSFLPMRRLVARCREGIRFDGSSFEAKLLPGSGKREVEVLYTKWLRKKAAELLLDKSIYYSKVLKVSPKSISIRNQKSRWGSASREGRVSFNCNLLKAPVEVIDYVVVHELCHLRVPNHSEKFWSLVASVLPDYRKCRKWLRDNGTGLMDSRKIGVKL